MITEKDISKKIGRSIKSPIRIGNVSDLGFNLSDFISFFRPFFEDLSDDNYLVREKQVLFLKEKFPPYYHNITENYRDFFEGTTSIEIFLPLIEKLTKTEQVEFKQLSTITRQRSISEFTIEIWDNEFFIERVIQQDFQQKVSDHRALKRIFTQSKSLAVESTFFKKLLKKITGLVKKHHPEIRKLHITSHFMRTLSYDSIKGENAPEGLHEDGSQYIISALVINRQNINGGESQIYEKTSLGKNEMIYSEILQSGEFIFQADTGEEQTFGNDLWHYVTPIGVLDNSKQGIRDIIGFDIDILA